MLFQVEMHARLADEITIPLIHYNLIIYYLGNTDLNTSHIKNIIFNYVSKS